jgi:steroid 5-alpha reductase family enzyme
MDPSVQLLDSLPPDQNPSLPPAVGSLRFWLLRLRTLPQTVGRPSSLAWDARAEDPLPGACTLMLYFALACWLLSVHTGNCSQVDKLWSITPFVYAWWFHVGGGDARTLLMAVLATAWGVRLTYNFARKGGYASDEGEDYRWPVLRGMMTKAQFQLFNLTFIALYQHALLLLIALPAYVASAAAKANAASPSPLGTLDHAAAGALLAFLVCEAVADQQQWLFYAARTRYRAAARYKARAPSAAGAAQLAADAERYGADLRRGFLTRELFAISRHPNFFCEQAIWVCFYALGAAAAGAPGGGNEWGAGWLNPSALGVVLLVLLFQGSTAFTEWITLKKYPHYNQFQQTTSRLLPWWPGAPLEGEDEDDDEDEEEEDDDDDDDEEEEEEEEQLEVDEEDEEFVAAMWKKMGKAKLAALDKEAGDQLEPPAKKQRATARRAPTSSKVTAPKKAAAAAAAAKKKKASPAATRGRSKSPSRKSAAAPAKKRASAAAAAPLARSKSPVRRRVSTRPQKRLPTLLVSGGAV